MTTTLRVRTGLTEKTALIHAGLDALIARASAQRLADLGGHFPTTTASAPGALSGMILVDTSLARVARALGVAA